MKYTVTSIITLSALTLSSLAEAPLFENLEYGLDARLRFETRNQQGLDPSNAGTIRLRPYVKTSEWGGFSGFFETEHTNALVEDYNSSPPGATLPNEANNTVIADPETNEINQAYIQYKGDGVVLKAGRQRINLDAQQFVGGVAWRQNEQTYDAVTGVFSKGDFKLTLGYIEQVMRIFGNQVSGPLESLEGDGSYIANLAYKGDGYKATAYTYIIDAEKQGAWASSNTYGGYLSADLLGGTFYAEGAHQTNFGGAANEYKDTYAHVNYSAKVAGVKGTAGLIYQGSDFRTPLQTAHKFNGFADTFLLHQIGLRGNWNGIADFYVSAVKKGLPGGIKFVGGLHCFLDENFDEVYGYEADMVLVKKLSETTTALVKAAYYVGNDHTPFSQDIAQVTVDLNFKF